MLAAFVCKRFVSPYICASLQVRYSIPHATSLNIAVTISVSCNSQEIGISKVLFMWLGETLPKCIF